MKNRTGSFKEKTRDLFILSEESKVLYPKFCTLKQSFEQGLITEAECVSLFILSYQNLREPKNGFQGTIKNSSEKKLNEYDLNLINTLFDENFIKKFLNDSLVDIFQLKLKGLPSKTNIALSAWLKGEWNLKLLFHIPSPLELLNLQVKNQRCVSLMLSEINLKKYILNKRDALSFCIHDLEHAVNFYSNPDTHLGQLGYYVFLNEMNKLDIIKNFSESNDFAHEFEYVISDMNAYSVHLFKYTRGILKKEYLKRNSTENEFNSFFKTLIIDQTVKQLDLNQFIYQLLTHENPKDFNEQEVIALNLWFESLSKTKGNTKGII